MDIKLVDMQQDVSYVKGIKAESVIIIS